MKIVKPAVVLLMLVLSLPTSAENVRIYSWRLYLADQVVEVFEKETGHTLIQTFYDEEAVRDAVISSGRSQGFDLIMMDDSTLRLMAELDTFQNLESISDDIEGIKPLWRNACGPCGIAYSWGTSGLMYRSSVAVEPIHSWRQLFEVPAEHQGRLVTHLDHQDSVASALMALGAHPFAVDKTILKQAFNLLQQQQAAILATTYGLAYAEVHGASSEMSLTYGFSSDLSELIKVSGQDDWVYVVPEEGTLLWADCWAAPNGRALKPATEAFLKFINRPDIAAMNAEKLGFATVNQAAMDIVGEGYRSNKVLFPPKVTLDRGSYYKILDSESERLRQRMITSLQSQ